MPTLVIARHAHATHAPMTDRQRRLTGAGEREAAHAAAFLADMPIEFAAGSPAVRTVQTAEPVCESAGLKLVEMPELYDSEISDWYAALHAIPADAAGAYIVGHNPTVWEFAESLSGTSIREFRPSTVAVFTVDAWETITPGSAKLTDCRNFCAD